MDDDEPVEFRLLSAAEEARPVLRRLVELYLYDFSEFDGADVDAGGEYGYRYLDLYWTEAGRHAFLFQVDGHWAGFALVRDVPPFEMAEFFVMRKYRRRGVGRRAAAELFRRFPGRWSVREEAANAGSIAFWRKAIQYPYTETTTAESVIQTFDCGA
jgi:predicted acetyltransferase